MISPHATALTSGKLTLEGDFKELVSLGTSGSNSNPIATLGLTSTEIKLKELMRGCTRVD